MQKETPSRTARKVALNLVTLGSCPGMDEVLPEGIVDATAELLLKSGAVGEREVRVSRTRFAVGIYRAFDWMMPGQFEAFAYRKAFCERHVREAIAAGAAQVLVIGAGYDTLGWRLAPEFPQVRFFEIDHPATARLKAKGIEAMGRRENLFLLAEDLAEKRLVDVLHAHAEWEPGAPSAFVGEGLLMYLPPEAVPELFKQCAEISGEGSRIAFSYVGTRADGRHDAGPCTGLILWLLKKSGEPWLWSVNPGELGPFLEGTGWTVAADAGPAAEKYGVEYFGVAVR